jgi:hypothetical protein
LRETICGDHMLQLSKVTLNLEFTTPAVFPYWMGSAFRGGFGQNLRRAICTDHNKDCRSCEIKDTCLFFYTYIKTKAERGYAPPIKPIILIPAFFGKTMEIKEKATLSVDVLFCGDFTKYLPHVILGMNLLGKKGFYSHRYQGLNRFYVKSIECGFTGKNVYDGETIYLKNLSLRDIQDAEGIAGETIAIGFKTPFTGDEFPPSFGRLLFLIRNRVIRLVNEYGSGDTVPDVKGKGRILRCEKHYHRLERRSSRSNKRVFHSYTGIVEYEINSMNDAAAWVLGLGFVVGCGPDASFGCGFLRKLG